MRFDAVVGDAALRKIIGADALRAVAGADLALRAVARARRRRFCPLHVVEPARSTFMAFAGSCAATSRPAGDDERRSGYG